MKNIKPAGITYGPPKNARADKLPNPTHTIRLLEDMCAKCGLDPAGLTVNVMGGERVNLKKRSVKIVGPTDRLPYQLVVELCVDDGVETIGAMLTYNEKEKGVRSHELFQRIARVATNRLLELPLKKKEVEKISSPHGFTRINVPDINIPDSVHNGFHSSVTQKADQIIQPGVDAPDQSVPEVSTTPPVTLYPPVYNPENRWYRDHTRFHLVIVALVSAFKPHDVFSFDAFEQVVTNDGGLGSFGRLTPVVGTLERRGFMRRLNKKTPARYELLPKAFEYASSHPRSIDLLAEEESTEERPPKTDVSPGINTESIKEMRRLADEHADLVQLAAKQQEELKRLQAKNLDTEDAQLAHQAELIEKRLKEINLQREGLAQERKNLKLQEQKLMELETKLKDPKLQTAIAELAKLRELVG